MLIVLHDSLRIEERNESLRLAQRDDLVLHTADKLKQHARASTSAPPLEVTGP